MECLLCNKIFNSKIGLHGHLSRNHEVSQGDYYHKFFPRYDKYDKTLINYYDYDSYFEKDFNSKDSLILWVRQNKNTKEVQDYVLNFLKKRQEKNNNTRIPSHVELKTLDCPSMHTIKEIFGSYDLFLEECKKNKLETPFSYFIPKFKDGPMSIFIDTREQRPLEFKCPVSTMKLIVGDYCPDNNFYSDVFVERKSVSDLVGTLSSGFERFKSEIDRALNLNFYIVVVVDCYLNDVKKFAQTQKFTKTINEKFIFHQIRDLMNTFNNLQFVFSGNRENSIKCIDRIFRLGSLVKITDLQWLKDGGNL